ncbi:hypothetical protein PUR71_08450 [Streptomyces sp. SP17BM10]|uniref:hypothetical protein n=1 Tax=Streptomyces sp. SP17BM10 TaxID=3002530 RepID=UPI002E782A02|nr:hypothetical protein [Streptomyces sp. SP17BM10]MEE1782945.1 hypothetical protein [Streptomyces sp. SP17BM10]
MSSSVADPTGGVLQLTAPQALLSVRNNDALVADGISRIAGDTLVSGFKHSLVTVVSAALAARAPVRIDNCPDIAETDVLAEIVRRLGGRAERTGDSLAVDADGLHTAELPADAAAIHGSVYLLPALLSRFGRASVAATGGCRIGDDPGGQRPVEQYVGVLERFGAQAAVLAGGGLQVTADKLLGCEIDLLDHTADRALRTGPHYSGATKMAVLTAAVAEGVSTLRNPYPKPDVTDLVDVLRELGADITVRADGALVVAGRGGRDLDRPARHVLVPDLIEVVTWVCAGTLLSTGPLTVRGTGMRRAVTALAPELEVFDRLGVDLGLGGAGGDDALTVRPAQRLRPVDVTVASHGVFSDSQPFLALLAALAEGPSTITETVWSGRFGYAPGLAALGVRLRQDGRTLTVDGPSAPSRPAPPLHAPDLRAAAVLLLAALAVPGPTVVTGTHHLRRGYPDLPAALHRLGARVRTAEPTDLADPIDLSEPARNGDAHE